MFLSPFVDADSLNVFRKHTFSHFTSQKWLSFIYGRATVFLPPISLMTFISALSLLAGWSGTGFESLSSTYQEYRGSKSGCGCDFFFPCMVIISSFMLLLNSKRLSWLEPVLLPVPSCFSPSKQAAWCFHQAASPNVLSSVHHCLFLSLSMWILVCLISF